MTTAAPAPRMKCPRCGAAVRLEAGSRRKRVQCPKCLHAIPVAAPEPKAAPARRTADRFEVSALESDLEMLRAENAMLRARVEGLQAEKDARAAAEDEDGMRARLQLAESALREATQLIAYLADMEKRIQAVSPDYIRALLRAASLETT